MDQQDTALSALSQASARIQRIPHALRAHLAWGLRTLHWQGELVLALAVLFLLVWLTPPRHGFEGVASYTWLHLTLEVLSILVAGMVFGVAWNAYSRERPGNLMILAIGLLATGLLDFAHALSFMGMPDFVTPAGPEKAINFWLAARFIFAVVLATSALRSWAPLTHPITRYLSLGVALLVSGAVLWVGLAHQDNLPRTFIAGKGLTPFKLGAEYVIVIILAVPAVLFLKHVGQQRAHDAHSLFAAAAISILSELCFTLYSDVTDVFNLLGHVYKLIAFAMIYRAVFVGSVREPFERAVQAERSMRAASSYVRSLIEASIDSLFMISRDGRLTDVNQEAENATGRPRNALIGTAFSDHFTEPDKARAVYQSVVSGELVRDFPLIIRSVSGQCTEVLCNATAYRNQEGSVDGIMVDARDVTDIRRAQQALVRQHALMSKITETSPIGITVWDLSGHVTFANAEAEKLLARAHDEIERLSYNAPNWEITDFTGMPLVDEDLPFHKVKATGEAVHDMELAISGKDGKRTLLSVNASPLLDREGTLEGIVATLDDVTERKAAEQMLRASEARLTIAMKAAHMGDWTWDVARDTVIYSHEFSALMGLPRGESHQNFDAVLAAIYPDDQERVAMAFRQALVKEQGNWVDFRIVWPDGSMHWLSAHGAVERDSRGKAIKIVGLGVDITERKYGELLLTRLNRALRTLSAVNDRLIHERDEAGLLNAVCRVIVEVGGYRMAWVGKALHDSQKTVQRMAQYGHDEGFIDCAKIVWSDTEYGNGPSGTAIRTGTTQVNQRFATNPAVSVWREDALKRGYQASISFPLRDSAGVHGVLTIYAGEPDAFNADEVKLLQELAEDLSFGIVTLRIGAERDCMALETQRHDARLRDSLVESIQALATTLELRDPYTAGHQRRVASLAMAIGEEIGLSEQQLQGMHLAASIHDVGKIHIPSEILNRPGRLSAIEMELIRTHAQAGHDILKDIRFPWPIARIVLEHHERLDGSGYPNRLRGDEILQESKILIVADVVEAMTSHRPYRTGLGMDAALAHITEYRGRWYDEDAVDACLRLLREGRYSFEAVAPHP